MEHAVYSIIKNQLLVQFSRGANEISLSKITSDRNMCLFELSAVRYNDTVTQLLSLMHLKHARIKFVENSSDVDFTRYLHASDLADQLYVGLPDLYMKINCYFG